MSEDYLEMFDATIDKHKRRFDNLEKQKNNMEYDLLTTDWILEKVRNSEIYAQNLYAAMCNNDFQKVNVADDADNVVEILKDGLPTWSCSWRYAGGIIADMRTEGDYIDWYCSGIRDAVIESEGEWNKLTKEQQEKYTNVFSKYVGEQVVTDEIRADLLKLGWRVVDLNSNDI